ncbi:hypothetical protein [Desulfobacter postgatei]|jgi:hypothetical protein|uniref:hypothetical protein n=1 Tax=Desulfobacter postgatei TaxID=2293 RepID=UPI002A365771|nr:hypothetical protein [Desulfobacter postgatei]MDX9963628.1 hypothetical protein [Desulfobacter postgatei]
MNWLFVPKLVLSLTALFLLSSCTAFKDYEGTAQRAAIANICQQEGFISYEQFSYYVGFQFGEYAHQNFQKVDDNKLGSMYQAYVEELSRYNLKSDESRRNLHMQCAQILTVAERVKPTGTPQILTKPNSDSDGPKTTRCFTTGGVTTCTTD